MYLVIEDKKVWTRWILVHRRNMNEAQHECNTEVKQVMNDRIKATLEEMHDHTN